MVVKYERMYYCLSCGGCHSYLSFQHKLPMHKTEKSIYYSKKNYMCKRPYLIIQSIRKVSEVFFVDLCF